MSDTEVTALSDGAGDDGTVSPTPVTVPKKRGRPANSEKPKKVATIPGRGRGRPAKGTDGVNKKPAKTIASADGSEEEGTESDNGSPAFNGDSADGGTAVASKRGRKPKGKRKLPVESTGKGRGRPKKLAKTDDGEDDEVGDDDDDGATNDHKSVKKAAAKGAKKGRGRPKKVNNSDDDSSDDKEERRSVGRPPSGGINLNIVRTGKGQGRPKKSVIEKRATEAGKKAAKGETSGDEKVKKPGRPSKSGNAAVAYVPTGKPRGRPKEAQNDDSQNEDGDAEHNSIKSDENSLDNGDIDEQPKVE